MTHTFHDFDILWQHIVQLYQDELGNGLKISSELTHDHIYPTQLCYDSKVCGAGIK